MTTKILAAACTLILAFAFSSPVFAKSRCIVTQSEDKPDEFSKLVATLFFEDSKNSNPMLTIGDFSVTFDPGWREASLMITSKSDPKYFVHVIGEKKVFYADATLGYAFDCERAVPGL